MIYAQYDLAVKDKHSLYVMKRMFVLYGEVVLCVCDPRGWTEKGLPDSPVLPEWPNLAIDFRLRYTGTFEVYAGKLSVMGSH